MTSHIVVNRTLNGQGPVATITLNRPQQRNAISFAMWGELSQLLTQLDADRDVRAVIITGAGEEAFSAGADISDFEEHRSDSSKGRRYNEAVNGLLETLEGMATPTISMIRGFAVGGGCEVAIATDLRLAATKKRHQFRHVGRAISTSNPVGRRPRCKGGDYHRSGGGGLLRRGGHQRF